MDTKDQRPTRSFIIPHRKNRPRKQFSEGSLEWQVSEGFYACAQELTKVTYSAINRAYPKSEQAKSAKVAGRYIQACEENKGFLTRYKTIVRDDIIPLAKLKKHLRPYDATDDRPTKEFRGAIDVQFNTLFEKLVDNAPLMLPDEDIESYVKVLTSTFNTERAKLADFLSVYEAEPSSTLADYTVITNWREVSTDNKADMKR